MTFFRKILQQSQHIFLYALLMGVMVFALKWLQWKYLIADHSSEIYLGVIALFFTTLGVWVAMQVMKTRIKTVVVEKEIYVVQPDHFVLNETALQNLGLTNREYEVLQQLAKGCSNAEIAENLFLSVSTIKTHASNLFIKMDVKNRTQALEKAKRLKITP